MIRRMADKFHFQGHLKEYLGQASDTPTSPSLASTHSSYSSLTQYDHRGSISTARTSISEWSKRGDSLDCIMEDPAAAQERSKASYCLDDFIIQRTLGTGSFGRVHLVRSKHNLRFYAIKVLNKEKIVRSKQVEHTNNEQAMLFTVKHPFIINLWGTFQDSYNLYMVMDFVPGGELFTLLRRSNKFPDPVAKFYAAEVALALNHLHKQDIIYRDLKPENILLNADGHIKIADFGFAKSCTSVTWTLCGTPDYLAPEICQQQRYNKSVDWYALGVLIFEMISGLPPYHQPEANPVALYEKIIAGPSHIRWPNVFSSLAKDMILKLMEGDASKRYGNLRHGSGDVFAHPWFTEVDWEKLAMREITAPYLPKINGDGDASAFDRYPEDNAAATYGLPGPDPHGYEFPDFAYSHRVFFS
ncbi:cAMP-dependent protein kinase catalytic subunit, variant 2 [Stygiomarasmius scandens]|uniref:cAMP-dependent protein kinase n=2 Tax=Marasmiellus scandens TaxID=2682957 RepID=A0ABR1K435_9AGAR